MLLGRYQQLNPAPLSLNKYGKYIRTYTGKYFYPANIEALEVDVRDIAHALSGVCRYNGHLREHYSVAQHSIIVSELVPKEQALEGLLHDAAEAYMPDMPSAIKAMLPEFVEYQERLTKHIFKCLGLQYPLNEEIDFVDKEIRTNEMYWLSNWDEPTPKVFNYRINTETPKVIEARFLDRFNELYNERFNTSSNSKT